MWPPDRRSCRPWSIWEKCRNAKKRDEIVRRAFCERVRARQTRPDGALGFQQDLALPVGQTAAPRGRGGLGGPVRRPGCRARQPGYAESQKKRKRIAEIFGWMKTVGLMRKTRHRGQRKVGWVFVFTAAAYNLVRMRNLAVAT
jgi:hypothetical protein